jgi:hypothetical protein
LSAAAQGLCALEEGHHMTLPGQKQGERAAGYTGALDSNFRHWVLPKLGAM